ncbi:response regulator [Cupriavidus necator]|uniref:response regulator n=1 Tax=Cupriavidus necator TaxID=106590 RepID=UPI00339D5465
MALVLKGLLAAASLAAGVWLGRTRPRAAMAPAVPQPGQALLDHIAATMSVALFRLADAGNDGDYRFDAFTGKLPGLPDWAEADFLAVLAGSHLDVHREDRGMPAEALAQSAATGEPACVEVRVHAGPETRWLRLSASAPMPGGGRVGYWEDATEAHRQQALLLDAQFAGQDVFQAKARYEVGVTHEIRTPLATIVGALELLRASPLTPAQAGQVELAEGSARLLMDIVGGVFAYFREEAGQMVPEKLSPDLRAVIDDVLQAQYPSAAAKGLRLSAQVDAGIAPQLVSDPTRLKRVLLNLTGNAVKGTPAGGIALAAVLVEDQDERQHLEISVADTGVGMPAAATQSRPAAPGEAEAVILNLSNGSGMGLALCNRMLRLIGGDLTLHSEPGAGTRAVIRITLPVAPPAEPPLLAGRRVRTDALRDSADARLVREYLTALGAKPWTADDSVQPDLQCADADAAHDLMPGVPAIVLVDRACASVAAVPGIPLLAGPVWWHGLRDVCRQALALGAAAAATTEVPAPLQGKAILVVEDYLPFQVIMRRQLELLGRQCALATNGAEALDMLAQQPYALVITDFQMPGMDGFELAARIRAAGDGPNAGVPVVALTGVADQDLAQRCEAAGISAHLTKPVRMPELRQCIERWARA